MYSCKSYNSLYDQQMVYWICISLHFVEKVIFYRTRLLHTCVFYTFTNRIDCVYWTIQCNKCTRIYLDTTRTLLTSPITWLHLLRHCSQVFRAITLKHGSCRHLCYHMLSWWLPSVSSVTTNSESWQASLVVKASNFRTKLATVRYRYKGQFSQSSQ